MTIGNTRRPKNHGGQRIRLIRVTPFEVQSGYDSDPLPRDAGTVHIVTHTFAASVWRTEVG
jgi:hypothetical protein